MTVKNDIAGSKPTQFRKLRDDIGGRLTYNILLPGLTDGLTTTENYVRLCMMPDESFILPNAGLIRIEEPFDGGLADTDPAATRLRMFVREIDETDDDNYTNIFGNFDADGDANFQLLRAQATAGSDSTAVPRVFLEPGKQYELVLELRYTKAPTKGILYFSFPCASPIVHDAVSLGIYRKPFVTKKND